jgi:hypothetical protein
MEQKLSFYVITIAVLLTAVLSPFALAMIGWPYGTAGGSAIFKIHPATYFSCAVLGCLFFFVWQPQNKAHLAEVAPRPVLIYGLCTLITFAFNVLLVGAGEISFVIDSLFMPVVVLLLVSHLTPAQQRVIFKILLSVFVMNSLVGMAEVATGSRLFPYTIQGLDIIYDKRATAFMGHPLTNAALTAVATFFVLGYVRKPLHVLSIIGLLYMGMIAFGGRSSLVLLTIALLGYGVYHFFASAKRQHLNLQTLAVITGVLFFAPFVLIYVMLGTTAGQAFVERLAWDDSASSRLQLFEIFRYISTAEIFLGTNSEKINALIAFSGLPWTIENGWVALFIRFGAILFGVYILGFSILYRYLLKGLAVEGKIALALFVVIAFANNSIAAKTPMISIVCLLAITAKAMRHQQDDPV